MELYAEAVRTIEIDNQLVKAPKSCINNYLEGRCLLYNVNKKIRDPERLDEHVYTVAEIFARLYKVRYRNTIRRIASKLSYLIGSRLKDELLDKAIALSVVLHDIGKAVPAYQQREVPSYRHEYISSVIVYKVLRDVLSIDYIIASQIALAVLLHHQPRTYRLLEDYNQFIVTSSIIREALSNIRVEDLVVYPNAIRIFTDALLRTDVFELNEIEYIEMYLKETKLDFTNVEKNLIRIQSIHVGFPRDDIRRVMRFFIAAVNHVILVCDNIAAYKNRAKYRECVKNCTPYVSIISSLIGR